MGLDVAQTYSTAVFYTQRRWNLETVDEGVNLFGDGNDRMTGGRRNRREGRMHKKRALERKKKLEEFRKKKIRDLSEKVKKLENSLKKKRSVFSGFKYVNEIVYWKNQHNLEKKMREEEKHLLFEFNRRRVALINGEVELKEKREALRIEREIFEEQKKETKEDKKKLKVLNRKVENANELKEKFRKKYRECAEEKVKLQGIIKRLRKELKEMHVPHENLGRDAESPSAKWKKYFQ